jgi:phenylacetate-coenzyme A ligase PaaK-like adenylate-forming protein
MSVDPVLVQRLASVLIERDRWSRARLLAHQSQALARTLQHAAANSPYYRGTIGHLVARQAPPDELPILTKSKLMAEFDRIVTMIACASALSSDTWLFRGPRTCG